MGGAGDPGAVVVVVVVVGGDDDDGGSVGVADVEAGVGDWDGVAVVVAVGLEYVLAVRIMVVESCCSLSVTSESRPWS